MDGLLGNLFGIVKRGAFGGLLQSDEDLLQQYLPDQYRQGLDQQQMAEAAKKARGIAAASLFSPGVDALERTNLIQQSLVGDINSRRQAQQQQQRQQVLGMLSGNPEQALAGGGGPTMANAEKMQSNMGDRLKQAYAAALSMGDLDLAKTLGEQIKQNTPADIFDKIDPSKFDPESLRKFSQTRDYGDLVAKADEPEAIKTLRILQQNPDLYNAQLNIKRAGATVVSPSFKIGNTFGEEVVKGIAGNVMGQVDAAAAAADTVSTIQNMRKALPNAIVGTGANARIALSRLGQTLGVGGSNDAERLAATSQIIQGLAKTQLDIAKANKGQGTFTDFERGLLARASSGDIDMSASELKTLFNAVEKGARKQYDAGTKQVSKMQQAPMFKEVAPFMSVPQLPSDQAESKPVQRKRFNPQTGQLE